MEKVLEHGEHAQHAFEHGARHAALLVAGLAALLAITEQQAKLAEIKVTANSVLAADSWGQYQGKSTRQLISQDLAVMLETLDRPSDTALAQKREAAITRLKDDVKRFQNDPKDGKESIAERAKGFEEIRDAALEKAHTFDKAAAAFELGIVLATASAITAAKLLFRFALFLGVLGAALAAAGLFDPEIVPF
jgi:hypothetical protein